MVKAKRRGKPQTWLKILNLCDMGERKNVALSLHLQCLTTVECGDTSHEEKCLLARFFVIKIVIIPLFQT